MVEFGHIRRANIKFYQTGETADLVEVAERVLSRLNDLESSAGEGLTADIGTSLMLLVDPGMNPITIPNQKNTSTYDQTGRHILGLGAKRFGTLSQPAFWLEYWCWFYYGEPEPGPASWAVGLSWLAAIQASDSTWTVPGLVPDGVARRHMESCLPR